MPCRTVLYRRQVLYKWHVDDPVCCTAIHGFAGAWSVIFVGLLAKPQYVNEVRRYRGGTAVQG